MDNSPANMHTYHVKAPDGNYCYWSVADKRLVPFDGVKNDFSELTDEEKVAATFHTSMNGAISYIPIGYTIEVRDLLAGTKFKLVERPWEIPDGYSFLKYVYREQPSDRTAAEGVTDVINAGDEPHIEVDNVKGFGLRINKTWNDAAFMADRDPVYFGIFYEDDSEGLLLVDGSLRQMAYGTSTLYWYYDTLPVPGVTDFSKYWIYEVSLTDPVVNAEGSVTGYSQMVRLDEAATLSLNGKQVGDQESSPFIYTVSYERDEIARTTDNVRVDTVTNSRPGIILKKTKWDGTTALSGAVFTLADEDGTVIGSYTSADDGLIMEAFFRNGVEYSLTETAAPQSYHGLEAPMKIKLEGETLTISGVDENYYSVDMDKNSENKVITVKNRPYQLVVIKMDKGSGLPLNNVEFKLYREIVVGNVHSWDPNPYPGYEKLQSDAQGIIPGVDNSLPAGTYQLRETNTPDGYQTLSGHVTFRVTEQGTVESSGSQPEEAAFAEPVIQEDGTILYQITVTNSKVFKVSIWKTNEGFNTITSGAAFSLYRCEDYDDKTGTIREGARPVVSGTTGTNGILALGSLTVGEYRLVETKTPDGYLPPSEAVQITVTNDGVTAMQSENPSKVYKKDDADWVSGQDDNTLQIRVWNTQGYELPLSGSPGTMLFTSLGGILVCLAGVSLLVMRKRRTG